MAGSTVARGCNSPIQVAAQLRVHRLDQLDELWAHTILHVEACAAEPSWRAGQRRGIMVLAGSRLLSLGAHGNGARTSSPPVSRSRSGSIRSSGTALTEAGQGCEKEEKRHVDSSDWRHTALTRDAAAVELPDPFVSYVTDFSRTLRLQVASLKSCTTYNPSLPVSFKNKADVALSGLIDAIDTFRTEMDEAAACCRGGASSSSGMAFPARSSAMSPRLTIGAANRVSSAEGVSHANAGQDVLADANGRNPPVGRHSRAASMRSSWSSAPGNAARASTISLKELNVDVADEEEEGPQGKCIEGVFNPNHPGRLVWDLMAMSLVLCDAMIMPFQMAYKDGHPPDEFDKFWLSFTTIAFAFDIFLNFLTAYPAGKHDTDMEPDKMVTATCRIARNYLRSWFPIDFFSTIPWGTLSSLVVGDDAGSSNTGQLTKLTKIVKFARFLRLMRMMKLAKLATIWERVEAKCGSVILLQGVGLLRVLFVLVCICHWNACIWWMIGQPTSLLTEMLSAEEQQNWRNTLHWTTIPRTNGPGEPTWTWLTRPRLDAYIFCFYWTLGVMRTMPAEVTPVNQPERIYIMVFMFFAFSAFAICVAQITQTFFKFSERKRVFNDDMAAVRMHLRKIKASDHLQLKVKSFLRHLYDMRKIQARESAMLAHLPKHVNSMLKHSRLVPHLDKLPMLQGLASKALAYVTDIAESKEMSMGDVLCHCGTPAEAAWVLMSGRLQVVKEDGFGDSPETRLVEVVDEECLLDSQVTVSKRTVVCMLPSTVIRIEQLQFFDMYRAHPNILSMRRSSRTSSRFSGCEERHAPPPTIVDRQATMDKAEQNDQQKGKEKPKAQSKAGVHKRSATTYRQATVEEEDPTSTAAIVSS